MKENQNTSVGNNSANKSNKDKDSFMEKKEKLLKEIDELKSIILQIEWSFGISTFDKVKSVSNIEVPDDPTVNDVPDINVQLQNDLYRYAGLHCTTFSNEEYVFHFSSLSKYEKENIFAVQILNKGGKGSLGKWVMPMSVDMDTVISENPISDLRNVPSFIKTCKHYVDCYCIRRKQYETLMKVTSKIKNCSVQTNLGCTQIIIELMGVHNTEKDEYIDLVIYLMYDTGEARPCKVEVESKTDKLLSAESIKGLNLSLRCFKTMDIVAAFEQALTKDSDLFTWSQEDNDDSPLELNSLSSDNEDGYLGSFALQREKRTASRKRKKKSRQKLKQKRDRTLLRSLNISGNNTSFTRSREKKDEAESPSQKSQRDIATVTTPGGKDNNVQEEATPLLRTKSKLRQTKLRFQLEKNRELDKQDDVSSSETEIFHAETRNQKIAKILTSTPLHKSRKNLSNIASTSCDISDITVNEDVPNAKRKTLADPTDEHRPVVKK